MLREQTHDERRAIDVLVGFGGVVAVAAAPEEVRRALVHVLVHDVGFECAGVFDVAASGAWVLADAAGVASSLLGFVVDADRVGGEVGDALLARCARGFTRALTVPLASGGGLFGLLVILHGDDDPGPDTLRLVEGLVDLASGGLGSAAQFRELSRSYATLRDSRAALEKGEKLRALGQMAAGVAHDLKNIINPLSLHLQILQRQVARDAVDARATMTDMHGVLKRGLETIERLRAFSHQTPSVRPEPCRLDALAREAIDLARVRAERGAGLRIESHFDVPPAVVISAAECVAALLNLLVNAIEAMPSGGTIVVSTGSDDDGSWVRVVDDGPGMSAEIQQRVFEPFFTTKGDDGTGLGLAMVYAFARRYRGRVELVTNPGRGAAFTLWFPHPCDSLPPPPR